MIIYLHGFDATSPGNHEKVLQLQFIDDDVRFVHYSTVHPRHDMSHLLKEVKKQLDMSTDPKPLICGVGLGAYWSERIGFLCGILQTIPCSHSDPLVKRGLLGLLRDPDKRRRLAEAGRATAAAHTLAGMAAAVGAVYRDVARLRR